MSEHEDMRRRYRRAMAGQLRRFDDEIIEFRKVFEYSTPEERAEIRAWLEQANDLSKKSKWNMFLKVYVENEEFDEQGEKIWDGVAEFSTWTMLEAWTDWEKGETYTPESIRP